MRLIPGMGQFRGTTQTGVRVTLTLISSSMTQLQESVLLRGEAHASNFLRK
jgi:hypothetical protein